MLLVNGPGNGYSELDGFLYVGLIATKRWTDANPDLATRTVRGFLKAHQAMHDPNSVPRRVTWCMRSISRRRQGRVRCRVAAMLPGFATDLTMKREQIERVEKFLNEFSSEKMNADLDKVFTNRFVEAATR